MLHFTLNCKKLLITFLGHVKLISHRNREGRIPSAPVTVTNLSPRSQLCWRASAPWALGDGAPYRMQGKSDYLHVYTYFPNNGSWSLSAREESGISPLALCVLMWYLHFPYVVFCAVSCVCTYIFLCAFVPIWNTCSALLLGGPGDKE